MSRAGYSHRGAESYDCNCGALAHTRRTGAARVHHTGRCTMANLLRPNTPSVREAEARQIEQKERSK